MAVIYEGALLAALGGWLLLSMSLWPCPKLRDISMTVEQVIIGGSLALAGPLLWWPHYPFSGLLLGFFGVVVALADLCGTAFVASVVLSLAVGGMLWQGYLCSVASEMAFLHPLLLVLLMVVIVPLFLCYSPEVPMEARAVRHVLICVPLIGGLLLALALPSLPLGFSGLSLDALLAPSPCLAGSEPALHTLAAWLAFGFGGIALRVLINMRRGKREAKESGPGGSLVTTLLPGVDEEEGPQGMPRPDGNEASNHFMTIQQAILSTKPVEEIPNLTESTRKLVQICRDDEEERNRILWGGGLY